MRDNSDKKIWEAVLEYCKSKISKTAFDLWLSNAHLESYDGTNAVILVESKKKKEILQKNWVSQLSEAFSYAGCFDVNIIFITNDELEIPHDLDETSAQDFKNNVLTFDNFIVGDSNRLAFNYAKAISKNPGGMMSKSDGRNFNPLFIYGPSGVGKTHLLRAIEYQIYQDFPDLRVLYITFENFMNELIADIGNQQTGNFRKKYRDNMDVLLLDDIQFIENREKTQEELFHTFDFLVSNNKQIVFVSDRPAKNIKTLNERMRSRMTSGIIADIGLPEFETRVAIIKRKAQMMNFEIPDNIATYIADQIDSNIRNLEAITKNLYGVSSIIGTPLTIALVKDVIKQIKKDEIPDEKNVFDQIIEEVARSRNVSVADIRGNSRVADVMMARKICYYLIIEIMRKNFSEVGRYFDVDHATVSRHINNLKKEMSKNQNLTAEINTIKENIQYNISNYSS